jgi:hypothetical protein
MSAPKRTLASQDGQPTLNAFWRTRFMTTPPLCKSKLVIRNRPVDRQRFRSKKYWIKRTCRISNADGLTLNDFLYEFEGFWRGYIMSMDEWTNAAHERWFQYMPYVVQIGVEPQRE